MELVLTRITKSDHSTIGELTVDGKWECYTLEDVERPVGIKIYGETAIPLGTYIVTIDDSPRFNRPLPHILNVPGFDGIRIHPGNTDKDTDGCILVGTTKDKDFVGNSKIAFEHLFAQLQQARNNNEQILLRIQEIV